MRSPSSARPPATSPAASAAASPSTSSSPASAAAPAGGSGRACYRRRTTAWSAGIHAIAGLDPERFRPDFSDRLAIYRPEDRGRVEAEVADALSRGRDLECRARVPRPDGTVRHVVCRDRPRLGGDGRAATSFGILQDVTGQVEAQLALEARGRENELHRAMIDALPGYIFAKDAAGRFPTANAATAALTGAARPWR